MTHGLGSAGVDVSFQVGRCTLATTPAVERSPFGSRLLRAGRLWALAGSLIAALAFSTVGLATSGPTLRESLIRKGLEDALKNKWRGTHIHIAAGACVTPHPTAQPNKLLCFLELSVSGKKFTFGYQVTTHGGTFSWHMYAAQKGWPK